MSHEGPALPPFAVVPRDAVSRKPAHGAPCNRCGVCCIATQCMVSLAVFGRRPGPCPALFQERPHVYGCGILASAEGAKREAAALLIGSGDGCDARINGEPQNKLFARRLDDYYEVTVKDKVDAAKRLWGIK